MTMASTTRMSRSGGTRFGLKPHWLRIESGFPTASAAFGNPPLEQTVSPQELTNLAELFTPQFVLHQLTELVDRGSSDAQLAEHMRHLRPWLTAERFSQRSANRHLQASLGGAE